MEEIEVFGSEIAEHVSRTGTIKTHGKTCGGILKPQNGV